MKKKLLFVIPSLDAGGAEKSLVNLLNALDPDLYEADLFMFMQRGLFLAQVPGFVRIITPDADMVTFQKPLWESMLTFLGVGKIKMAWNRLRFAQINKLHKNSAVAEQKSWRYLQSAVESLPESYDAAIGFLEKSSIYFVVEKVRAKKKMGFIHNDYTKLRLDKNFDTPFFEKLTKIVSVSDRCVGVLNREFPQFSGKIVLMHNIVSSTLINSLAQVYIPAIKGNVIISVGRLHPQKGFDLAVEAAKILKDKCVQFHWYIIGEGHERKSLDALVIRNQLTGCFHLLGLIENPYPYIRQATVFVQPSRYEGKSIVIDEAKILAKPIVLTNFSTAKDQIKHNINGIIVDMTPHAIADGIMKYMMKPEFTQQIIANLQAEHFGTDAEIKRFYEIIS